MCATQVDEKFVYLTVRMHTQVRRQQFHIIFIHNQMCSISIFTSFLTPISYPTTVGHKDGGHILQVRLAKAQEGDNNAGK